MTQVIRNVSRVVLVATFLALHVPATARAATVLPDPNLIVDGLPISRQFDDFISYSTQLLTQFGFAGFSGASGVGGLDVVLLTQAGGIDNDPVSGGFVFEDPAPSAVGGCPGCDVFAETWGAGIRPNGPVLVDNLVAYLQNQFGPDATIPVFTFDLVEPGTAATRDLELVAEFFIWDPVGATKVASWALDNLPQAGNGVFDPTEFITVEGMIDLIGTSGTVYSADNTGSGEHDFLFFAPTMDLTPFLGMGYEFHIFTEMMMLDGGGEEAFLSGTFTAPGTTIIPEPSTIALLSIGLASLGLKRRKFFSGRP